MEGAKAATLWYLRLTLSQFFRLVAADLEELRPGPGPYVSPQSLVICVAVVGFLALLFLLWLCALREKLLTTKLSKLMEEKHQLLEKASLTQEQVEGLESSLQEAISKKVSTEVARLKATYEELKRSNSQLTDEILLLEKELDEEKSKCSQQEQLKAELSKTEQSLQEKIKSLTSQIAEAKENLLALQTSETQLQGLITEALKENSQRQASQKQLLQEAEALQTQVCELTNQRETLKHHVACAEEVLYDKEDHIWSLISRIAKMRDWAAVLGEDLTADGDLKLEMIGPENAAHLKIQPKSALEKLVYGAMLKACLQTMEGERNQARTQLFEVNKTKRDLEDQMKVLHTKLASLQSQNTQAEQVNRLQQEVKMLAELYVRNCRELITQLMAEEKHR
jgi:DNA repair exonuclease SbcCD ATPase subunit